jgi:hypothetical protein
MLKHVIGCQDFASSVCSIHTAVVVNDVNLGSSVMQLRSKTAKVSRSKNFKSANLEIAFFSSFPDCTCDRLGTEICDHFTGECTCLPGVEGEKCDRCVADHWGYESETKVSRERFLF